MYWYFFLKRSSLKSSKHLDFIILATLKGNFILTSKGGIESLTVLKAVVYPLALYILAAQAIPKK
jgi:hypothetical protein